ncbi:MAG: endo-1,4-beta-xylanase [Oscillospiraceae bacterium]|jgi:endo-1,4-beta-xylanase|nr:endo-1,4-beta-xylanase [Oscillospiraceae bacterium]
MKRRLLTLTVAIFMILALVPIFTMVSAETEKITEVFINFEDGTTGGFQGESVKITHTDEESHSGNYSLFISNKNNYWDGAWVQVAQFIRPDTWYRATFWIKMKTPEPADITIVLIMPGQEYYVGMLQYSIEDKQRTISSSDGWMRISAGLYMDSTIYDLSDVKLLVYTENESDEYYIDDVSFEISSIDQNLRDLLRMPSLWEAYENYFMMGTGTMPHPFDNKLMLAVYKRHFNLLEIGGLGGSAHISPSQGVYEYPEADYFWGHFGNEDFIYHTITLVTKNDLAQWLVRNPDGTSVTRAQAISNMEEYITNVAGDWAGRIKYWDVVNEAFKSQPDADGNMFFRYEGNRYTNAWYLAFENGADRSKGESGADHIEYAFRFARVADPSAVLFLNDNIIDAFNAGFIADYVKNVNDKWLAEGNDRLLIEGIGIQSHLGIDSIDFDKYDQMLEIFSSIGVQVSISEFDIYIFGPGTTGEFIHELEEIQAELHAKLFMLFKKYSESITFVKFGGFDDGNSWLDAISGDDSSDEAAYLLVSKWPQYAHLFNDDFTPKLAYFAVIDPEGYLAGNYDTEEKRNAWLAANMLPEPDPTPAPTPNDDPQTPQDPTSTSTATPDPNAIPLQDDPVVEKSGNIVLWITIGVGGTLAIAVVVVLIIKKKQ